MTTDERIKQELINKNYFNSSTDEIINSISELCCIINKNDKNEVLQSRVSLEKYLLQDLGIAKEDNSNLYFLVTYILKKYKWVRNFIRTYYKRPDLEFVYRPLVYPEYRTLSKLGKLYKVKFNHSKESIKKRDEFTKDLVFVSTLRSGNILNGKSSISESFYLKPNKKFKKDIENNRLDLIGGLGYIELILLNNSNDISIVFGASSYIGNCYAMRTKVTDLIEEFEQAEFVSLT